jgi:hypothetical protein
MRGRCIIFSFEIWMHDVVFYNSLDGRRPANLQTALVRTWYASASE